MKNIKKFSVLLLCLLLAFGMILPISAASDATDVDETPEWVLSKDEQTLSLDTEIYTKYPIPMGTWIRPYVFYEYNQSVGEDLLDVGCPGYIAEDESLIQYQGITLLYSGLSQYATVSVYVQPEGKANMDAFTAGEYAQYELGSYHQSSIISGDMISKWNGSATNTTVDVTTLADVPRYYVLGYDQTLTLAHVIGAVFELEGEYLYVYYDALDNSCFDANGNLSFRQGTISALRPDAEDSQTVASAIENAKPYSTSRFYEPVDPLDPTISIICFLLIASPLLFILPALLLVFGIVMRCIKKIPNRKRWNTVIILSALWLVGSFVTSLLLLIPTFFL